MKKLIIIFVLIPLLSIAQEVQKVEVVKSDTQIENLNKLLGQNEIKIDFLDFIIFPALTLGYEKNRNSSTAYGATMFINFDTDLGSEWNDKFAIFCLSRKPESPLRYWEKAPSSPTLKYVPSLSNFSYPIVRSAIFPKGCSLFISCSTINPPL